MRQDKTCQSHTLYMSTYSVHPSRLSMFPRDKMNKPVSSQIQALKRTLRDRVQTQRLMPFLQGSNGLRDRACTLRSIQSPSQSMFPAHKDPILKLRLCR